MMKLHQISNCSTDIKKADIIFVHGLGGKATGTWKGVNDFYWPAELDKEINNVDIWTLDYNASPIKQTLSLPYLATSIIAYFQNFDIGAYPIVFICHSLGGVLAKQILRNCNDRQDEMHRIFVNTKGVVFLATPHAGSLLATGILKIPLFNGSLLFRALNWNDPNLNDLNLWFRDNFKENVAVYFETSLTNGVKVVDANSSDPGISGVRPIPVEGADHLAICKPKSNDDAVYLNVKKFIEQVLYKKSSSNCNEIKIITDKEIIKQKSYEYPLVQKQLSIWSVPFQRNDFFTGREVVLTEIHNNYNLAEKAYISQAIVGISGIGKTQTAVEYAYRFKDNYSIIWWVQAENNETIATHYWELAKLLGISGIENSKQDEIIDAVRKELEKRRDWLLIFDNVEFPKSINDIIPRYGGHVLITSCFSGDWSDISIPIPLEIMSENEGQKFVLDRTECKETVAASTLVNELGGFPLALEQACAYIKSTSITIEKYLELFRSKKYKVSLLQEKGAYLSGNYPYSVMTTFNIVLDKVNQESHTAIQILKLFAFLASDSIYLELLSTIEDDEQVSQSRNKIVLYLKKIMFNNKSKKISLREVVSDPLRLNKEICLLKKFSLVQKNDSILKMHRLVQLIIQDKMTKDEKRLWAIQALKSVNKLFVYDPEDSKTWINASNLFDNAKIVLYYAQEDNIKLLERIQILSKVGLFLGNRGIFEESKKYQYEALKICEEELGPSHSIVGILCINLGMLFYDSGDFAKALSYAERSLEIVEPKYGKEHETTCTAINNLGMVYEALGRLEIAKEYYNTALKLSINLYGENSIFVAKNLNNLASLNQTLCLHEEACLSAKKALAITQEIYGEEDTASAYILVNLAMIYISLGKLEKAKTLATKAYKMDQLRYGIDHYTLICDLACLGMISQKMNDIDEALSYYKHANQIYESTGYIRNQHIARVWNNLGMAYKNLGELEKGKEYIKSAVQLTEEMFGKDHIELASQLNNLGMFYYRLGDVENAKTSLERAVKIAEKGFGINHTCTELYKYHLACIRKGLILK